MFRVTVSGEDEFLRNLQASPRAVETAMQRAAFQIRPQVKDVLISVFEQAMAVAGEGFPDIYKAHLSSTLRGFPIEITAAGLTLDVLASLDNLGSYDDFEEGFHYHAQLGEGEIVGLPYEGEPLKNDISKRYTYWLSMVTGVQAPGMPPPASVDETYAARVTYWESIGKAPEWLLLNYGQGEYYPYVNAYPIVETLNTDIEVLLQSTVEREIDMAMERVWDENYIYRGERLYYNKRNAKGQYTKRG